MNFRGHESLACAAGCTSFKPPCRFPALVPKWHHPSGNAARATSFVFLKGDGQVKTRILLIADLAALMCLATQQTIQDWDKKKDEDPFANMPKTGPVHKLLSPLESNSTAKDNVC